MIVTMDWEDLDLLELAIVVATEGIQNGLTTITDKAAEAAIKEMQGNHPYTDRTFLLTQGMKTRRFGRVTRNRAEAIVTFDAPYANIVNDGSVKSKAYPFMPQGERAAGIALMTESFNALSNFIRTIGMGR